ncbi:MAG: CHAT domain-containing protein [Pseudomonadota bacterium]
MADASKTERAEFRIAASKHQKRSSHLEDSRGFSPRDLQLNVGVDDIVQVLKNSFPDRAALLLYELGDFGHKVWAITAGDFCVSSTSMVPAALSRHVMQLRQGLGVDEYTRSRIPVHRDARRKNQPDDPGNSTSLEQTVGQLSSVLLPKPVRDLIVINSIDHIVIVPSRELSTVPFPLLYLDGAQLVDRVSTMIAPSLADLFEESGRRPNQGPMDFRHALVVGNPLFGDTEWHLANLPGAEREAQTVANRFGVTPLIKETATKKNVLASARSRADIIYLATHGVASTTNPLDDSFIALAPDDGTPGRWTAREIQHERLSAKLVVLSACQTGLGGVHDAGIVGLSRAFQLAGCSQIVMSLWNVDDQSTANLMQHFMDLMFEGVNAPEALRRSSLNLRDNGALPWQWSSFTVFSGCPYGSRRDRASIQMGRPGRRSH